MNVLKRLYEEVIAEHFADVAGNKKYTWVDLSREPEKTEAKQDMDLRHNLFDLVNFSYIKSIGEPHVGVKTPDDVLNDSDYNYWEAIDLDDQPDANAVIFGKKRNGIKLSGIGHDGRPISKSILLKTLIKQLHKHGNWIEASSPVSDILLKNNLPIIQDKGTIQKLFPTTVEFIWGENGSYIRKLRPNERTGKDSTKPVYLFGNPII